MRDRITIDFAWKLFSVILAVVLWLTVHNIYEEPKNAFASAAGDRVTYDNLPVFIVSRVADVGDFRVVPGAISVTVSGPPDIMATLQANQIRAVVDLTDITSARDLRLRVDVSTPPGVTLLSVDPSKVGVILPPKALNDMNP
jgi:YbbR domain-containing protein